MATLHPVPGGYELSESANASVQWRTVQVRKEPPRDDLVRSLPVAVEVRSDEDGAAPVLHGHLARFDEWAEIASFWEGNFMERIAPGAFKKTLRENRDKIRVLLNHGQDPMLGDKPLGAVRSLSEDEEGVPYEVELFRGIPDLVMDGLRAGQYGASFRFKVVRQDIEEEPDPSAHNPKALAERTIRELQLHEFGPVTFPAYEGATAGIRSLTDRFLRSDPAPSTEVERRDPPAVAPGPAPTRRRPKDYLTKGEAPPWRL